MKRRENKIDFAPRSVLVEREEGEAGQGRGECMAACRAASTHDSPPLSPRSTPPAPFSSPPCDPGKKGGKAGERLRIPGGKLAVRKRANRTSPCVCSSACWHVLRDLKRGREYAYVLRLHAVSGPIRRDSMG